MNKSSNSPEHAVIINFVYRQEMLTPLFDLEEKLHKYFWGKNIGEYDGHELAMDKGSGVLYFYGPNAEQLFIAIKLVLSTVDFMKGAVARLRFGPPEEGVKEIRTVL